MATKKTTRPRPKPNKVYYQPTQPAMRLTGGLTLFNHSCYNSSMQTIQKARLWSGKFAPGQSGNPGGRPKDEYRVAELARSYTVEAIETLADLMLNDKEGKPC